MTPQQIEALKLALEALEGFYEYGYDRQECFEHITAIKEALAGHAMRETQRLGQEIEQDADSFCDSNCVWTDHHPDCKLAQPEQEPVIDKSAAIRIATALGWTPPRTWVGLTDEEVIVMSRYDLEYAALIGEVQRKIKEKNT